MSEDGRDLKEESIQSPTTHRYSHAEKEEDNDAKGGYNFAAASEEGRSEDAGCIQTWLF